MGKITLGQRYRRAASLPWVLELITLLKNDAEVPESLVETARRQPKNARRGFAMHAVPFDLMPLFGARLFIVPAKMPPTLPHGIRPFDDGAFQRYLALRRHNQSMARATKETKRGVRGFYDSHEWREVRYAALIAAEGRCQCCGRSRADGIVLHVDHIKPRSKFPHLSLEVSNLQALCEDCNRGKGAWDQTDWRDAPRLVVSN